MTFVEALPTVNATLNATSAVLLLLGRRAAKAHAVERHRKTMLAAVATSALFLVFYLVRWSLTGTHRFVGPPGIRAAYLVLLATHMLLAIVVVPMVLRSLQLGLARRDAAHRKLVRWTFPVWLYVSVTGVVVYVMLYHLAPGMR